MVGVRIRRYRHHLPLEYKRYLSYLLYKFLVQTGNQTELSDLYVPEKWKVPRILLANAFL